MRKFTFKLMTIVCFVLAFTLACSKSDPEPQPNQTPPPNTTTVDTTTVDTTTTTTSDVDGYIIIDGIKREYKKASGGGGHPNYVQLNCEEDDHNIYIAIFGNGQKGPTETTTYKTKGGNYGLKELASVGVKMVFIKGFFINKLYGAVDSETEVVTVSIEGGKMRVTGTEIPIGNGKTMELDISIPVIE